MAEGTYSNTPSNIGVFNTYIFEMTIQINKNIPDKIKNTFGT